MIRGGSGTSINLVAGSWSTYQHFPDTVSRKIKKIKLAIFFFLLRSDGLWFFSLSHIVPGASHPRSLEYNLLNSDRLWAGWLTIYLRIHGSFSTDSRQLGLFLWRSVDKRFYIYPSVICHSKNSVLFLLRFRKVSSRWNSERNLDCLGVCSWETRVTLRGWAKHG